MKINHPHTMQPEPTSGIDWEKINEEYKSSGLSQKAFCQNKNIKFNQFTYQRQRLQQRNRIQNKLASIIVHDDKLNLTPHRSVNSHKNFILEWPSGKRLIIPIDTNSQALNIVLTTLGRIECSR